MTTTTRARRAPGGTLLAALAAVLVVALGACGSENADDADAVAGDTASSTSETPTEPSESSESSEPTETTEPAPPTSSETSEPAVPAGTPECAAVWVEGARLPRGYRGCAEDGALVPADRLGCSSGQTLIRYADRFYAVAGGTVSQTTRPLLEDPDYTETVEGCRA